MAIPTITSGFTLISTCDAITGWSGANDLDTEFYKQGAASLSCTLRSAGLNTRLYTWTGNLTSTHIRMWMAFSASNLLHPELLGGIRLTVVSATGTGYWYIGGSDTYNGGWKMLTVDTRRPFDEGTCDLTAITSIGFTLNLTGSAKNQTNTWYDFLVYGDGYTVTGGTDIDPLTIEDVYQADNALGLGVIQKINSIYFLSSTPTFGSSTTSENTYFEDSGRVIIFENNYVNSELYKFQAVGSAINNTVFNIGGCVIGAASNQTRFDILLNDENLDSLLFNNNTIISADQSIFKAGQYIDNTNWRDSNMVSQNGAEFVNCSFMDSVDLSGAFHMNDGSLVRDCRFDGNINAVYITDIGPYIFNHLEFFSNIYDIHNNSGVTVTVNLVNGGNASTYTGNIVIINNTVLFGLTGLVPGTEVRVFRRTAPPREELFGVESVVGTTFEYAYNYTADIDVAVAIFNIEYKPIWLEVTLGSMNTYLPIQQVYDRNYSNPV